MHRMQRCSLLLLMFRCLCVCVCVCSLDITMSCAKMAECSKCRLGFGLVTTHTHTRLTALFPGIPRTGTRKVKPIWILLKQETVSGSGISWAICKSAPRSRQITMPASHCWAFYRPDALPAAQPTVSKHWRHKHWRLVTKKRYIRWGPRSPMARGNFGHAPCDAVFLQNSLTTC